MTQEINIAEILRGKPKGTKLYSPIFGECEFLELETDTCIKIQANDSFCYYFNKNGHYSTNSTGECCLFPSNEMRDWSKFAWKKGDVLVSNDGKTEVVFDGFKNNTYTSLVGRHALYYIDNDDTMYYNDVDFYITDFFSIEEEEAAKCCINIIEERLGGKLNMKTLEIEPAKPKWTPKPFDKVLVRSNDSNSCWKPMLFSMMLKNGYAGIDGFIYPYCIPYNNETAKLIGTTNDYKED